MLFACVLAQSIMQIALARISTGVTDSISHYNRYAMPECIFKV